MNPGVPYTFRIFYMNSFIVNGDHVEQVERKWLIKQSTEPEHILYVIATNDQLCGDHKPVFKTNLLTVYNIP